MIFLASSTNTLDFYPRPPRGGRRGCSARIFGRKRFLSTPSARRATRAEKIDPAKFEHFYPRPPRGGRRVSRRPHRPRKEISIHALREEGDVPEGVGLLVQGVFLSTPSARRATMPHCIGQPRQIFLSTPSARRATR